MYSDKVRELVAKLPNSGTLQNPTHQAHVENPVCPDELVLQLEVLDGTILECRYQAKGCPAVIAAAAALSILCTNKQVSECLQLQPKTILSFLSGLPKHKLHGIDLALAGLRKALGP